MSQNWWKKMPRYSVIYGLSGKPFIRVYDREEKRVICKCDKAEDAQNISKAMNISNSWDPILASGEKIKSPCTGCYNYPCICDTEYPRS